MPIIKRYKILFINQKLYNGYFKANAIQKWQFKTKRDKNKWLFVKLEPLQKSITCSDSGQQYDPISYIAKLRLPGYCLYEQTELAGSEIK